MMETKCKEFALFCLLGNFYVEKINAGKSKQNRTAKLNHQVAHPVEDKNVAGSAFLWYE
jgi:hypothetical protein